MTAQTATQGTGISVLRLSCEIYYKLIVIYLFFFFAERSKSIDIASFVYRMGVDVE